MNIKEAAEKALETLEYTAQYGRPPPPEIHRIIDALRTALAEAEAEEPVAWYYAQDCESAISFAPDDRDPNKPWQPLYTHPPRREPVTETKCKRAICHRLRDGYCAPCHEGYYP